MNFFKLDLWHSRTALIDFPCGGLSLLFSLFGNASFLFGFFGSCKSITHTHSVHKSHPRHPSQTVRKLVIRKSSLSSLCAFCLLFIAKSFFGPSIFNLAFRLAARVFFVYFYWQTDRGRQAERQKEWHSKAHLLLNAQVLSLSCYSFVPSWFAYFFNYFPFHIFPVFRLSPTECRQPPPSGQKNGRTEEVWVLAQIKQTIQPSSAGAHSMREMLATPPTAQATIPPFWPNAIRTQPVPYHTNPIRTDLSVATVGH